MLDRDFRARNKLHLGTRMECVYALNSYGIPAHALPIDVHDEIKVKQHLEFLKMRKHQEAWIQEGRLRKLHDDEEQNKRIRNSKSCVVVVPAMTDVLLGRGKPIFSHRGNATLHMMVKASLPRYEACQIRGKAKVSQSVVDDIKDNYGGRFLKQHSETGIWLVVDDDTARLKVSSLFRTIKRRGHD